MSLRKIEAAPCWPITLEEARRHLAIDASTRDEDSLIDMLIQSASADAEMKTGRVLVKSRWEWEPDSIVVGERIEFPTCPVVDVKIYDLDEESEEPTDISSKVCKIAYPSPEPQGNPMLGWLLPIADFPQNHRIELTVGYDFEEKEEPVEQKDSPILVVQNTRYAPGKIHLAFSRSVYGSVQPSDFTVRLNGEDAPVEVCVFEKGGITLSVPALEASQSVTVSFLSGLLYDQFQNYVQPIVNGVLPVVSLGTEADFVEPEPVPTQVVYTSLCPTPVKQWILVRTGTLYCQRSEIALRAGKSNDALFPDGFINNLLDPYRTRFN